jgi:hypothetical protein
LRPGCYQVNETVESAKEGDAQVTKPCGHAAPVDSFAQQPANLPTSAWTAKRRPHDHKAGDDYFFFK